MQNTTCGNLIAILGAALWQAGCTPAPETAPAEQTPAADHGHSHSGDDTLVWGREGVEQAGYQIQLGHHSQHLHAGETVEPAVGITREGAPVADAKVFNALVAGDGGAVIAAEVAMVYEPPTADEPAHYAQGELQYPAGVERAIIRFRIVLPGDAGETTHDLPVEIE